MAVLTFKMEIGITKFFTGFSFLNALKTEALFSLQIKREENIQLKSVHIRDNNNYDLNSVQNIVRFYLDFTFALKKQSFLSI